eukprot:jgi/Ulvmu1/6733/UM030_0068.1
MKLCPQPRIKLGRPGIASCAVLKISAAPAHLGMTSMACAALALLAAVSGGLAKPVHEFSGFMMVANRGAGTVSFIDPSSLEVTVTFDMPDEGEPMYIAYDYSRRSRMLVADRKNERLVAAQLRGNNVRATRRKPFLPLPAGPFHTMSAQFFVTEVRTLPESSLNCAPKLAFPKLLS